MTAQNASIAGTMDRRSLLQRAMLLVGASATLGACDALGFSANASDFALSPEQKELVIALSDTIVPATDTPGAVDVGVPDLIETMMREWAAPATREQMVAALQSVDDLAGEESFASLDAGRRQELLGPHDVAALEAVPRTDGLTGIAASIAGPSIADPGYGRLKELVVILYYYSQIGATEELSYTAIPGSWQPSVPVTADTKPEAGLGLF